MVLIAVVALLVIGSVVLLSRKNSKTTSQTFTDAEKAIISKLYQDEQTAFNEFKKGKEDILTEYEALKAKLSNIVSLGVKIPATLQAPVVVVVATTAQQVVDPTVVQVPQ